MATDNAQPRIEPLTVEKWAPEVRAVWTADSLKGNEDKLPAHLTQLPDTLNLTRILAHHPELAVALYPLSTLVNAGLLSPRDRELVTLRVALRGGSGYLWSHHYETAQAVGVTEAEVLRTADDPSAADWSPHEAALITAADEICDASVIGPATWKELRRTYDEARILQLLALVGTYRFLATVLNTAGAALDEWRPERPLPSLTVPTEQRPAR
ncbi:carboxymuconolactone decarboxylase family protein [Streptomyces turgidiscabies]|uniref:Alkylhydroperoxidase AhpD family core domain protein n=1 Tax=Streptomyces turgidiscabies (strain Car8) TaxID=698760 RepID=L7FIL7_STRT8|nr:MULTISPECIES: carboxymuconolactone decarboxylase family protein [Streptomyces]ELP70540.1 alkylhydroperoxidase AhpD family core domain protein [Streptomyces turgidiscabies Car8]MDX3496476.1 carboxymuconolactone decarboxylase family protein [Streptomyces turgidiscabies]GAQ76728.1 carboxymuconolactone decarboxylase family [Streptomyces turgidiscabies]